MCIKSINKERNHEFEIEQEELGEWKGKGKMLFHSIISNKKK